GIYIILNESISICENIYKANKKSLPKWIKKLLSGAKGKIDEMGDEKDVEKDS
ncbi:MAG: phage holin family protein, partial [Clostridia bacterium]|nr:phage holin family protein [Clostridia bacterium]